MFNIAEFGLEHFQGLALVVLRSSGLILLAPVFGHAQLPKSARVGLVFFLSLILFSANSLSQAMPVLALSEFVELGLRELLIGLLIGFMFRMD